MWRIYYDIPDGEFELIASFWPSLPADLQAAYENPKDAMLVFKGNLNHCGFFCPSGYFTGQWLFWCRNDNLHVKARD